MEILLRIIMFNRLLDTEKNTLIFLKQLIHQHVMGNRGSLNHCTLDSIDPILFNQLVFQHRLELILGSQLTEHEINTLSTYPLIKKRCLSKIHKHLKMQQCLQHLNLLFVTHHIPYVVLKGLPLNAQLYGKTCVRTSNDIDLLVHTNHLIAAHHCLIQAGFQLKFALTPQQLTENFPFLLQAAKDLTYKHPSKTFRVELHFRYTSITGIHFEPLQKNHLIFFPLTHHVSIPVLEHHINFLYLCVHAAAHKWQRLQWLVDIAVFYQKCPLNWPQLITLAQQYKAIRPLLEASILLQKEFKLIFPPIPYLKIDRLCVIFRLRYITKYLWYKPYKKPYKWLFYDMFLCSSLNKAWRYLVETTLGINGSAEQLVHHPRRSSQKLFWVSLYNRVFWSEKGRFE